VVPVLVGAALALEHGDTLWGLFPVVLLCSVLFQAGTNAINDYFDFARSVDGDDPRSGSSGVLTRGLLHPNTMFVFGVGLFGAGVLLGLVLVYHRASRYYLSGWPGCSAVTSTRMV
jgi:1,4-dihydroxy-2-naphthoate octaprenyltransferase